MIFFLGGGNVHRGTESHSLLRHDALSNLLALAFLKLHDVSQLH